MITVPFNPTDRAFGEDCYSNPERLGSCIRGFENAIRKFLDGFKPQPPFISNPSSFRCILHRNARKHVFITLRNAGLYKLHVHIYVYIPHIHTSHSSSVLPFIPALHQCIYIPTPPQKIKQEIHKNIHPTLVPFPPPPSPSLMIIPCWISAEFYRHRDPFTCVRAVNMKSCTPSIFF